MLGAGTKLFCRCQANHSFDKSCAGSGFGFSFFATLSCWPFRAIQDSSLKATIEILPWGMGVTPIALPSAHSPSPLIRMRTAVQYKITDFVLYF
jgi:hypothetical protein